MGRIARTIFRTALFVGMLIGASHADVAAAFLQSGGTSTGAVQATRSVGVIQTARLAPVVPGTPAQTLSGTFDNRSTEPVHVAPDVPSGRGTGSWTGGKVAFNNKPGVDQNACQGATVKLRYTTS